jgi:hypothetical protein
MSLVRMMFDMSRTFAHGMAYTAIARLFELDGLTLKNFDLSAITCSPVAKAFYESIPPIVLDSSLPQSAVSSRPVSSSSRPVSSRPNL